MTQAPGYSGKKALKITSFLLIISAVFLIVIGVASLPLEASFARFGFSFWAALLFVLSGTLGLHLSFSKDKTGGYYITLTVLSVLAVVLAILLLCFSGFGLYEDVVTPNFANQSHMHAAWAMHSLNLIFGIFGGIVALVLSIVTCTILSEFMAGSDENAIVNRDGKDSYGTSE